eukprot:GGOE01061724.1.p1 GENE.GGOE01061724.1~~GGOE01061724.1.p1  ORF type:complete len:366 (-),score=68.43 GGOE01061724.1:281-1378(-)
MATHYDVLGIPRNATESDIRQAFRKKALELHPDKNPNGEAAFKKLRRAYETLSDAILKARYDAELPPPGRSSFERRSNAAPMRKPREARNEEEDFLNAVMKEDQVNNLKVGRDFRSWYRQQQEEIRRQESINAEQNRLRKEEEVKEAQERELRTQRFRDLENQLWQNRQDREKQNEVKRQLQEQQEAQERRSREERWQLYEQQKQQLERQSIEKAAKPWFMPNPPKCPTSATSKPSRRSVLDDVQKCLTDREVEELLEARIASILAGQDKRSTTRSEMAAPLTAMPPQTDAPWHRSPIGRPGMREQSPAKPPCCADEGAVPEKDASFPVDIEDPVPNDWFGVHPKPSVAHTNDLSLEDLDFSDDV